VGYAVSLGQLRTDYNILVRKTQEKRPLEKSTCEANAEMGCENVGSTLVFQNKLHSRTLENKAVKFVFC
jgi:hypothetical protein